MFSRFSEEERQLLRFKYEGIKPNGRFDYSLRTYFRKQKKLLKKVELYLGYLGIDEHVFKTEYENIDYFQSVICALKWQKRRRNLSSVAAAFDICRPKVAAAK